jgi:hypothetical protein
MGRERWEERESEKKKGTSFSFVHFEISELQ